LQLGVAVHDLDYRTRVARIRELEVQLLGVERNRSSKIAALDDRDELHFAILQTSAANAAQNNAIPTIHFTACREVDRWATAQVRV
jgi:hypothetical protein